MNAACKQWWQDHSDELTEWDWDSFRRVWEVAQLSVVAPSASHNSAMDAIAIIDSVLASGWFDFDRTKGYDALVAVRQLLQQHQ